MTLAKVRKTVTEIAALRRLRMLSARTLLVLGCAWLAACTPSGDEVASPGAAASRVTLRVMAFNIEWGGTHVSFGNVVEAIQRADPDVVAVQEAEGNLERLAAELGWHHDPRNHVIARYPLIDPPDADGKYVFVEVRPGLVVAVANVHLPSDPYGEDWIRDGRSADEVVALERRVRLPAIQPFLDVLPPLAAGGIPVFLAGDFNSPSQRDWTAAAIDRWPQRRYRIEWPVAKAVEAAGFRDAYRQRHSDPLEDPGFTWWAERPKIPDYNPGPSDSWQSRIDFLWHAGPVEVTGSTLVGERGAAGVTIDVTPWPSDHRAVVGDFVVEAAPAPFLVAASTRRFREDEPVSLVYRNRTAAGAVVIASVALGSARGTSSRRIGLASESGTLVLDEPLPASGRYRVTLEDDQRQVVSRNYFWVLPAESEPMLVTAAATYGPDDPLALSWQNAPGNRYDWVAVYREDSTDEDAFLAWAHTDARIEGTVVLTASHAVRDWPLPEGSYVARLMADDGYAVLAESEPFTLRD